MRSGDLCTFPRRAEAFQSLEDIASAELFRDLAPQPSLFLSRETLLEVLERVVAVGVIDDVVERWAFFCLRGYIKHPDADAIVERPFDPARHKRIAESINRITTEYVVRGPITVIEVIDSRTDVEKDQLVVDMLNRLSMWDDMAGPVTITEVNSWIRFLQDEGSTSLYD